MTRIDLWLRERGRRDHADHVDKRPTYLGQVQKQVPRGFHHRARPADFTLRFLWREIQEKGWPKMGHSGWGLQVMGSRPGKGRVTEGWTPQSAVWLSVMFTRRQLNCLGLVWTWRLRSPRLSLQNVEKHPLRATLNATVWGKAGITKRKIYSSLHGKKVQTSTKQNVNIYFHGTNWV